MRAAILAVGSELLGTDRLDTNSLRLTAALRARGVQVVSKGVVGDDVQGIADSILDLLKRADLLLVTGGLGPTADDVTRQGVARACGRSLAVDDEAVREIEGKFTTMGLRMPALNRRQAERIEGAEWIPNRRGTARGLRLEVNDGTIFLFPGVPVELEGMIESDLVPWLQARTAGDVTQTLTVRTACLPESSVEERMTPAYARFGRESISVLASPGEVLIKGQVSGPGPAGAARLHEMESTLRELLGDAVFATGEALLEAVVGDALEKRGETVATAESCTGGLIAERITRIPGSSRWMLGAIVAYANRVKTELLDVDAAVIERHGAVSREVAVAMAEGARVRLGADWGIGVTGIAGPAGGSSDKPVGTVHLAVAGGAIGATVHRELRLPGDRLRVRQLSSQWGLDMLRRCLLNLEQLPPAGTSPEYSG